MNEDINESSSIGLEDIQIQEQPPTGLVEKDM